MTMRMMGRGGYLFLHFDHEAPPLVVAVANADVLRDLRIIRVRGFIRVY